MMHSWRAMPRPSHAAAILRALVPVVLSAATVAALCTAFLVANFGAAWWWFALLAAIPLTLGLPTTLTAVIVVSLWNGPPLWGFLAVCVVAGWIAQWLAARGLRRLVRARRGAIA